MKKLFSLLISICISNFLMAQDYKIDFKKDLLYNNEDSSIMIIKKVNVSGGDKKNYLCKVVWSVGVRKDLISPDLLEKLVKFSSVEASFSALNRTTYKPKDFTILYVTEDNNFLVGVNFTALNSFGVEKAGSVNFNYTIDAKKIVN
jgi:hypothetical protein